MSFLSTFRERRQARLRELRSKGQRAFIVQVGVLRWGIPVRAFTPAIGLPLWCIGGCLFGAYMWEHTAE